MPTSPNTTPESPAASATLARLAPRLQALTVDQAAAPRADAKVVAMAALKVADLLDDADVKARFARLPREEFDPAHLSDLRDAAWAVFHAKSQLDAIAAAESLPLAADALERALQLRERMLRVSKYWLEDDAEVAPKLNAIARKKGNADLMADLAKLAALYRAKHATLQADARHYSAADADEAEKLAADAARKDAEHRATAESGARDLLARSFALLSAIYDEVRAAGLYLFRRSNAAELFPALSSLPAARGRPKKASGAPPSDPPPAPPAAQA